jgi:hypothetical protein
MSAAANGKRRPPPGLLPALVLVGVLATVVDTILWGWIGFVATGLGGAVLVALGLAWVKRGAEPPR